VGDRRDHPMAIVGITHEARIHWRPHDPWQVPTVVAPRTVTLARSLQWAAVTPFAHFEDFA
jgi:hypothetical protein